MIIRGHSGQDIRRMIWRRRYKFLAVAVLILIAVTLTGCSKPKPTLNALDRFWDTLGGKTTDLVEETK
jgi:type IV secretory pathway VirB2 component (pilin)